MTTVNPDAIDLTQIADPQLRAQLAATIAENQQLRQYCCAIEREAQFKSHFLARISHELRSPLSGIIGSHQLVIEDLCEDRDEEIDFVRQANAAALRLVEMLDSLLLVSRIESGRLSPKLGPVAIEHLLKLVREPIELEAANSSLSFALEVGDPQMVLHTDAKLLTGILINFLELAIDFGRQRRLGLKLACQVEADRVVFALHSAAVAADFSSTLDCLDRHVASQLSAHQGRPEPSRLDFSLTPSLRLTLGTLLLELLGGGCGLPEPLDIEGGTGSRLCFWVPRA
ncbi:MAG: sensor histidine kinase [Geitlerinemataceae cyanobacterium]